MCSLTITEVRQITLGVAAILLPGLALALGLGEAQGQPIIGQRLRLEIPIVTSDAKIPGVGCFSLQSSQQDIGGSSLPRDVRLELLADQSKLILTAGAIREPIISFAIKVNCGHAYSREYLLLPDIEKVVRVPVVQSVSPPGVLPVMPKTDAAPIDPARGEDSIQYSFDTSLEKLARERYPLQPKAREKFMRLMMEANSGVTETSQIISAGTVLRIPKGLPVSRSARPNKPDSTKQAITLPPTAEPSQRLEKPVATRKAQKQDKLVIGTTADSPEQKILADLEWLIPMMKEQNLYQDAMTRKIASLEEDYSLLQQRFAKLEERVAAIDKELQVQKNRQPPSNFDVIELIFATFLGGILTGLGLLLWQKHKKHQDVPIESGNLTEILSTAAVMRSNPESHASPAKSPENVLAAAVAAQNAEVSIQGYFSETGVLTTEESVDPVAEADVLMAYGRDTHAEEILLESLKTDPTREAIHLKLLEIYASRNDATRFEAVATDLRKLNGGQGQGWSKAVELARSLGISMNGAAAEQVIAEASPAPSVAPPEDLFSAAAVMAPVEMLLPVGEEAASLEFDLDLGTSCVPAAAVSVQTVAAPAAPAAEDVACLDFDFNLDPDEKAPSPAAQTPAIDETTAAKAGNEIDFDIDVNSEAINPSSTKDADNPFSAIFQDFPLNGLPSEMGLTVKGTQTPRDDLKEALDSV